MMNSQKKYILAGTLFMAIVFIAYLLIKTGIPAFQDLSRQNKLPGIFPDYSQITIPSNIAPMNFVIRESGQRYYVKIYSHEGDTLRIDKKNPKIIIASGKWKRLLKKNKGNDLYIDIYVRKQNGKWIKYNTIVNHIAHENVDSYLVYRLINPGYILWNKMGIYSRNVENFKETPILANEMANRNCVNCHSFCQNNANDMMFHIRGDLGGTILYKDGIIKKINTATNYTMSAGVYPAWHPNGKMIAFSVNKIRQKFNTDGKEPIEVYDGFSDIILYDIEANRVTTSPKVSTKNRETMPTWSPDGKYLYFCSAPEMTEKERHSEIFYDLMRISYDYETGTWGDIDTLLTTSETKKSIAWPKVSPDGKYLLFCLANHGYFTIHYHSSDLYLMDLESGKYEHLTINSESVESYHSWSKNSRWFVFSSKKENGLCSRPYFCHIDKNGKVSKPFILPQKDPEFYHTYLKNYNIPEMVSNKITINKNQLFRVANRDPINAGFDPNVDIDALSGATKIYARQ